MKPNILEATRHHRITAILRGIQPERIQPVVQALFDGGIRLLEVTFDQKSPSRLEDTAGAIRWAKETFGTELYVGAGTVMSQQEVLAAKQAGAEFILAPNVDEQVIRLAVEQGMCAIPGAMTPTEIARAYAAGAEIIKLFPAGNLGLGYCKAVMAPLNHIPMIAVGGVDQRNLSSFLKAGFIGTFIGAIPGAGGDIAVFVSYAFNKGISKHPEKWGTGIPNGVAATESANNGCSGGAMIPLLSLGVPGDSVTAILLGAFIMKGITPGPMMYVSELPTVYKVFAALMLANLCMLIVGCLGVRIFAKIVSLEKKVLYPIILIISLLGAFSINKNVFDVGVCVVFGVIGWLMNKYEFPLSPILLALILGPMCEQNFVRFMDLNNGNFGAILHYPIAIGFFVVAVAVVIVSLLNQRKINKTEKANANMGME